VLHFRCEIVAGMARYRDCSWLGRMVILPVATFLPGQAPAVGLDQFDDIADLHSSPFYLAFSRLVGQLA